MACEEGTQLSERFEEAEKRKQVLEADAIPFMQSARRIRSHEINKAEQFHEECKSDLARHVQMCPQCRPGA